MPEPDEKTTDAVDDDKPVDDKGTPPVTDPTNIATVQAELDAANAKLADFGKDNAKLRGQRRDLRSELADLAKPGDDDDPKPKPTPKSQPDTAMRDLAMRTALRSELINAGADPKLVDLVGLSAIDLDGIEIENGQIEGMAEAATLLLKERPELKTSKPTVPGTANGAPGGSNETPPDITKLTREEFAKMGDKEFFAMAEAQGEVLFQIGESPVMRMNISPTPNPAFARVHGVDGEILKKITGG